MDKVLPSKLQSQADLVDRSVLDSAKVIGLYFSALWCVPCKDFTKKLMQLYEDVNRSEKQLEIVLCSGDLTDSDFDQYYKNMPWLAIPFDDDAAGELAEKHKVTTMPVLILIDKDGKMLKDRAQKDIIDNPSKPLSEVFESWKSLY
mmetsp:Transcript_1180/g.1282  ORF Transcript_1180/g.1282 Transcript_1180/m.1282 type:complete len:146 (+) Transcript_1180:38-475(+)